MTDNKKYYYLKLKENHFDSEDMKLLEAMDNGYIYSNILMKLTLISLKNDGKIIYRDTIPYDNKMLATVTNHNIDNIRAALKIFKEMGLIEILTDGAIYMMQIEELVGHGSTEAERKAKYRKRIEAHKQLQNGTLSLDCPGQNPPELSKSKEVKEKSKELNKTTDEIISFLNEKANTNYRTTTETTRTLIKARLKEKFSFDDFCTVIDKKVAEWKGTDMECYLRPQTLFGTKFESYLNQRIKPKEDNINERVDKEFYSK